jgi:hypothetical protein
MSVCEGDLALANASFRARLDFHEPADVAGRRILYVEGENDNQMLVRKGGRRLNFVVLKLDPHGSKAQAESLFSITKVGFHRLLDSMVLLIGQQMEADPSGTNTRVECLDNADFAGRPCRHIRVRHPQPDEALVFHQAQVWLDRELGVPVRVEAHGWPEQPGASPPLLAEYTYADLELNACHAEDCFDASSVRGE